MGSTAASPKSFCHARRDVLLKGSRREDGEDAIHKQTDALRSERRCKVTCKVRSRSCLFVLFVNTLQRWLPTLSRLRMQSGCDSPLTLVSTSMRQGRRFRWQHQEMA
jgi:hypothetical protein